jgi:TatD DNase family protein
MQLVDTHNHIHFPDYGLDPDEVIKAAREDGVERMICVGCTLKDSRLAIDMAAHYDDIYASIGLHPHDSKDYVNDEKTLQQFRELARSPKVVAVGEIGLDYYYNHSSKEDQIKMLRFQLDVAKEYKLPLIFHVRDAFDDFWPIFDEYEDLTGVVHCFSAGLRELEQILARGLYVGLNGIMTFTRNDYQLAAAKAVPLDHLLLETDAPFLTPVRGTICQPKHVRCTAEFLAELRGQPLDELAAATTQNAKALFNFG